MTESWTLNPAMAYCSFCIQEWARATQAEADKAKADHEHLRHNQPLPVTELAGSDWQTLAMDAVRKVAARGGDFTVFEALREFGIADPPNAKTALGRFSSLVHDLYVAHPCGYRQSSRGGTKKSAVAVWNRDQSRCVDATCRAKVGAA